MEDKMKPTKIIEEPVIVKNKLKIVCDNGESYTTSSLAAVIGLSQPGFYFRLQKLGWDHPEVLEPKNSGAGWFGTKRTYTKNTSEFGHLTNKDRPEKLAKIPKPTKFDRMFG